MALYARVSTLEKGQDPETQLRPLREYAQRRGFAVVEEYVDQASSTSEERTHYKRMMAATNKRQLDNGNSTRCWSGATTVSPARPRHWSTR